MSKVIAQITIIALLGLCTVGNMWYTFGLWPKSWGSFFGFFVVTVILTVMSRLVNEE